MPSKRNLFDDCDNDSDKDEDGGLTINQEYAERYENWRKKEEYQKLKDKYGEQILSDASELTGSDDDDSSGDSDQDELQQQLQGEVFDKDFIKTYMAIKKNDPSIYDKSVTFIPEASTSSSSTGTKEPKKKKEKKMTLKDYHMKLVKERGGVTEEDQINGQQQPTEPEGYYEQLDSIRNEFKAALDDSSDEDEEEDNGLIIRKDKSNEPSNSKSTSSSPLPLDKPKDQGEKFLYDFILNKKYLNEEDRLPKKQTTTSWKKPVDESKNQASFTWKELSDEEEEEEEPPLDVKKHRFEESGGTKIKRYPRNIVSARDIQEKEEKAVKRKELRERKKKEREEDLKRFSQLKKEFIEEKLRKLKEISGNNKINEEELSKDVDMTVLLNDAEFDPDKHDRNMAKLFGDDYYEVDEEEETEKPHFEFMEEVDEADEDRVKFNEEGDFVPNDNEKEAEEENGDGDGNEDEEDEEESTVKRKDKKKRKRSRDSKKKVDIDKLHEYDDVIAGSLPVRFNYRKVKPNDFGLSPEEILLADDKELNRWVSLKRAVGWRSQKEEEKDYKKFQLKKSAWKQKRVILSSLFKDKKEEDKKKANDQDGESKKKKKRRKKKTGVTEDASEIPDEEESANPAKKSKTNNDNELTQEEKREKRRQERREKLKKKSLQAKKLEGIERLKAYGLGRKEITGRKLHTKLVK